jgi:DNA-binding CsgD family transcriptional regulator
VAITPAAERYLVMMQSKEPYRPGYLPDAVGALVASLPSTGSAHGAHARSRVPAGNGEWLSLQATRLGAADIGPLTAVMIQPAGPSELVPLVLQGSGLTARETEVAGCVLRGLSTQEIAADLSVSSQTVQQHLKSVFDKLGVPSRGEMLSTLFLRHYWPRMASGTPIGPDGWFADGVHGTNSEAIDR